MDRFSSDYSDYRLGAAIGFGAASIVYAAIHGPPDPPLNPDTQEPSSQLCAIKLSTRHPEVDQWLKEVRLLSSCRHPNILPILAAFTVPPDHSQVGIVTAFIAGGSLFSIMAWRSGLQTMDERPGRGLMRGLSRIGAVEMQGRGTGRLDEEEVKAVTKQVLSGLGYLHNQGIIHRDIKAGNILIEEDGTILLADLGIGMQLEDQGVKGNDQAVGSPCWMAPEVITGSRADHKSDIWSLGITTIELLTGSAPLSHLTPSQILTHIATFPPPSLPSETGASKALIDFLGLCLVETPSSRADVSRLEKHQWLKNARKPAWLADNLLEGVAPLIHRQELRRIPSQYSLASRASSWDFNPTPAGSTLTTPVRPSSHLPRSPSALSTGSQLLIPPGRRSGGTSPATSMSRSSWARYEGVRDSLEVMQRTRKISGLERQAGSEPGRRRTASLTGLPRRSPQSRGSVLETITPAGHTGPDTAQRSSSPVAADGGRESDLSEIITESIAIGSTAESSSYEAEYSSVPMAISSTSRSSDSDPRPLTPPSIDNELATSLAESTEASSPKNARGSLFSRRKSIKGEKDESAVKRVLRGLRVR